MESEANYAAVGAFVLLVVVGSLTGPCVVTQPGRLDDTCPTWPGAVSNTTRLR